MVVNTIIHGDCLEVLHSDILPGTVDLVVADPPFNINYDYDEYCDKRSDKDYLRWSEKWVGRVHRALRPGGAFWLVIGDEYAAELKMIATRRVGFVCRSWVVWYYTFGVHCQRKFTRSHVHLFYLVKIERDSRTVTFNADAIRVPSARQLVYGDRRANPKGRIPDDVWVLRPQELEGGFGAEGDVWFFPRVCGTFKERQRFHGCQMPEAILARIIKACSNDGDLVVDPFSGSGTTLAAAKRLRRRYIGIEISSSYVSESRKRLERVQ